MNMKRKLLFLFAVLLTAVTCAWADGIVCSINDIGSVICTDGSIYKTLSQAESASKTPVAMIAYIKDGKALAIALRPIEEEGGFYGRWTVPFTYNTSGEYNEGKTAKQWAEEWNTTTPVENATWRLPSSYDWVNMIVGCGGEPYNYDDIYEDEWGQWCSPIKCFGNIHSMLQALSPEIGICTYEDLVSGDWAKPYGTESASYWTTTTSAIAPGVPYTVSFANDNINSYTVGPWFVDWSAYIRPCLAFVAIDPNPVTDIALDKTSANLTVGGLVKLTATITPEDASDKRVTWTTKDPYVKFYADEGCTIPTGGLTDQLSIFVQGTAAGTATVTVTSYADETKSASCEVTVNNVPLALSDAEDNTETIKLCNGMIFDVTLNRTLKAGGWNTFSVPFTVSHEEMLKVFGENAKVKMLRSSSYSDGKLSLFFTDGWILSAGLAYLVKVENDVVNPTFTNATISDYIYPGEPDNPWSCVDFLPVINPVTLTPGAKTDLFVVFGNKLTYPVGGSTIKGFRAYFHLKGAAVEAQEFVMEFDDDEATAIGSINTELSEGGKACYDISGRRVADTSRKGLYIVNGKKVVTK